MKRIIAIGALTAVMTAVSCGCTSNTKIISRSADLSSSLFNKTSEPTVFSEAASSEAAISSVTQAVTSSSGTPKLPISERSVRLHMRPVHAEPNCIEVGEKAYIGVIHSPTQMASVKVDYQLSDETVAKFAYNEMQKTVEKFSSGCIIEGLSPGDVTVTIIVTSREGNCSASCRIIVLPKESPSDINSENN